MDAQLPAQSKLPSGAKEGKEKQARRLWTTKEEEALLRCMLDEYYTDKWKADNGFKTGFYVAVEKQLRKVLPGTTLKAQPNIESKVKNWKEKYGLLADMKRLSGFSWNHVTKAIEVDSQSVWEDYEQNHPKVKGMNGKAFPMFKSWEILFGKDRATGEVVEDAADAPIQKTSNSNSNSNDDYYYPQFENGEPARFENGEPVHPTEDNFVDLSCNSSAATPTTNVPKKLKKKARVDPEEASVHEAFGNFMSQSNEMLQKIANAVGYDKEMSSKRQNVFNELMKLDLEMADRFIANKMIVEADERVDTFYGIPDDIKQSWVKLVVEGKIYPKDTM